jgi:hypothetical protein
MRLIGLAVVVVLGLTLRRSTLRHSSHLPRRLPPWAFSTRVGRARRPRKHSSTGFASSVPRGPGRYPRIPLRRRGTQHDSLMPEKGRYWLIQQVRALPPERGGVTPAAALTAVTGLEHREMLRSPEEMKWLQHIDRLISRGST